uniref:Serine protease n=1 Tax=Candidatus Kentrum sp. FW TaxID=2126338 RepID=A0A450T9D3_9GAMM|nr:MAG: V8-like Glu-specific endopeptidase [Candidatus Kentron sp. FW]
MEPGEFSKKIKMSVADFNDALTRELCGNLIASLPSRDQPFPVKEAKQILSSLRRKRHFDLMCRVADAFIFNGQNDSQVRRQYGQALIDSKQLAMALSLLMEIVDDPGASKKEKDEARGLIGRVYKQAYINSEDAPYFKKQQIFDRALTAYYQTYQGNPDDNPWHGINAVALLARGRRDGLRTPENTDFRELARRIREAIEEKEESGFASMWDCGTALEASVALDEVGAATNWAEKYVAKGPDAFELASTLRQLEEAWSLSSTDGIGREVLPFLKAALLEAEGGAIALTANGFSDLRKTTTDKHLERVFGRDSYKLIQWLKMALDRCHAVGLVTKKDGTGIGTGFVINGKSLSPRLADDWYFLTNSHVVTDNDNVIKHSLPNQKPIKPDQARITFELLFEDQPRVFQVKELIWTSPPDELDASLLQLDKPFYDDGVAPYPIEQKLPDIDDKSRIYIAGHPGGRRLTISLHDNHLIDYDDHLMQYRTPTDPGSSGSPVFNDQWDLVGLHHAGSGAKQSLGDPSQTHEANEGIRIKAITEAIESRIAQLNTDSA